MMRPKPRANMPGSTAWLALTAPMTCTSHIAVKIDGSVLMNGALSTEPALLTRIPIGPRAASAAATCRLTAAAAVTSAIPQPAASPAATASRNGGSLRPITVTMLPAPASAAAMARPMPHPPPVTKACWPVSAIGFPAVAGNRRPIHVF